MNRREFLKMLGIGAVLPAVGMLRHEEDESIFYLEEERVIVKSVSYDDYGSVLRVVADGQEFNIPMYY